MTLTDIRLKILNVHENNFMDRLKIVEQEGRLRLEVVGPDVPVTNMFSAVRRS